MASITTAISGKAGSISGTPGSGDIGSEITEWSIDDTVESLEATNMSQYLMFRDHRLTKVISLSLQKLCQHQYPVA